MTGFGGLKYSLGLEIVCVLAGNLVVHDQRKHEEIDFHFIWLKAFINCIPPVFVFNGISRFTESYQKYVCMHILRPLY